MRRLIPVGLLLVAVLALAGPASAAAPCARDDGVIQLRAPDDVAYDREGLIVVDAREAWQAEGVSNVRLDMRDATTGQVFYGYDFTPEQLAAMNDLLAESGPQRFTFYVVLNRGDGPAIIRLTYDRTEGPDFTPPCSAIVERTVTPFSGIAPRVSATDLFTGYHKDEAVIKIVSKQPSCDVTALQPITVTVRGEGRKATFRYSDPCVNENAGWRRTGGVPGLTFAGERVSRDELRLYLRTTGHHDYDRYYRLAVSRGSRVVLRRWANAWVSVVHAKRIWEGSDAFWNYCIRRNRDVFSSGGRLYCVRPGSTTRQVFISRKGPRR